MNKRHFKSSAGLAVILIIISSLVVFSGCVKKEENEIKIGAILPLTGDAAKYGDTAQKGIDLAVDEINSKGGIIDICINNAIYWYPRRIPVCDQRVQPRFSQTAAAGRSSCWMRG